MIPLILIASALVIIRVGVVKTRYVFPHETDPEKEEVISVITIPGAPYGVSEVTMIDTIEKGKDYLLPYPTEEYPLEIRVEEKGNQEIVIAKRKWKL